MKTIQDMQSDAASLINKSMPLTPVRLKYPFPARPRRMLGLVTFDGEVYCSEKLVRAVFLQIRFPVFMRVYSTFLFPKIEYDLPVFICETVVMGGKRIFIVDAHKAGGGRQYDGFFDGLLSIRNRYPELMQYQKVSAQGIQSVFSRAACQLKIPRERDGQAVSLFTEYLAAYLELLHSAAPLTGSALAEARASFEAYLKTVVDHDPGVKGNIIFFGKEEGVQRALDIFYGA